MTGRVRRALVWVSVPLALAACSQRWCTLIGCARTGVIVTIDGFPTGPPVRVQACLDSTCVDRGVDAVPGTVGIDIPETPRPHEAVVWVRITQDRSVLLDTATRVTLEELAPNGEACGPICWSADLTATPGGLRQTSAP